MLSTQSIAYAQDGLQFRDADKALIGVVSGLKNIAEIQILQAPSLSFRIPRTYDGLPRLTGRAAVRLTFLDKKGEPLFADQEVPFVEITLDGYSAPLSAGRLLSNLMDGFYNGISLAAD